MTKRFIQLDTGLDFSIKDNETGKNLYEQDITDTLNKLAEEIESHKPTIKIIDRQIERFEHELHFVGHAHITERASIEYTLNFLKELKEELEKMTDKRSNKLADDCMSCIKCDSDFDGVTGFREFVTEKKNDKRFIIDKSDSWWDLLDTNEYTRIDGSLHFQDVMEQVCNLLNGLHEENKELKEDLNKLDNSLYKLKIALREIKHQSDIYLEMVE